MRTCININTKNIAGIFSWKCLASVNNNRPDIVVWDGQEIFAVIEIILQFCWNIASKIEEEVDNNENNLDIDSL